MTYLESGIEFIPFSGRTVFGDDKNLGVAMKEGVDLRWGY